MAIRLILADDHPVLLSGISLICSAIPDVNIVGKARNSTELLSLLGSNDCDILLSDYIMPGGAIGDGMGMMSYVRRGFPHVKIIAFTVIENDAIVSEMMRIGVKRVLNKTDGMHRLVDAIRAVHADECTIAEASEVAAEIDLQSEMPAVLSPREFEVLRLFVYGVSVTQIARQLNRTKQTVSTQKLSAMNKLGLQRDVDLYRFAYKNGILPGSGSVSPYRVANQDDRSDHYQLN